MENHTLSIFWFQRGKNLYYNLFFLKLIRINWGILFIYLELSFLKGQILLISFNWLRTPWVSCLAVSLSWCSSSAYNEALVTYLLLKIGRGGKEGEEHIFSWMQDQNVPLHYFLVFNPILPSNILQSPSTDIHPLLNSLILYHLLTNIHWWNGDCFLLIVDHHSNGYPCQVHQGEKNPTEYKRFSNTLKIAFRSVPICNSYTVFAIS